MAAPGSPCSPLQCLAGATAGSRGRPAAHRPGASGGSFLGCGFCAQRQHPLCWIPGSCTPPVPACCCRVLLAEHGSGAPLPPHSHLQCKKHNVDCSPPQTTARLLDKLVGEFIESQVRGREGRLGMSASGR